MTDRLQYKRQHYHEYQIAYLAGIMDGEGCFFIGNFSCNPKTGTPYYQTTLSVSNTDEKLIDWLMQTFGGLKGQYTRKQLPKSSRKHVFRWQASGERLKHLCELMLPYLVCKKDEAELMLEMRKTYEFRHFSANELTSTTLDKRKELFLKLRSMHCRTGSIIKS